jgi:excisionase family DNA binding protein
MNITEREPVTSTEPRIGRSVSLDHAAQLLGVSRRTIYNRIREGRLQTIRTLGGSQRVLLESVGAGVQVPGLDRAIRPDSLVNRRTA